MPQAGICRRSSLLVRLDHRVRKEMLSGKVDHCLGKYEACLSKEKLFGRSGTFQDEEDYSVERAS